MVEEPTPGSDRADGFGRRDLLRKGLVGGAIVWSAPVVVSAIRPAMAWALEPGSPFVPGDCGVTHILKYDPTDSPACDSPTNPPAYQCFTSEQVGGVQAFDGCDYVVGFLAEDEKTWCLVLDSSVTVISASAAHAGRSCVPGTVDRYRGKVRICFDSPRFDLSNIEIIFCT